MLNLNKDNFKTEVLESKTPVLVDFFSIGCGPCRSLEPNLKLVEEKMSDVKFAKIEAGDALETFMNYNVVRVPTMILFKEGQEVDRKGGVMSEKDLTEWINSKVK